MFSEQNVIETVAPHDTNITITQGRLSKHKGHLRACQSVNWSIAKVLCCRSNQVGFKNAHEREQKVKKREKQSRKACKKSIHHVVCASFTSTHTAWKENGWAPYGPCIKCGKMRQSHLAGPMAHSLCGSTFQALQSAVLNVDSSCVHSMSQLGTMSGHATQRRKCCRRACNKNRNECIVSDCQEPILVCPPHIDPSHTPLSSSLTHTHTHTHTPLSFNWSFSFLVLIFFHLLL